MIASTSAYILVLGSVGGFLTGFCLNQLLWLRHLDRYREDEKRRARAAMGTPDPYISGRQV